jgi:RNA polymerase sigma-70 factor (ECF subfamily)
MTKSEAFDKLRWLQRAIETYEPRLVQFAARILGDADRARDVVQDAFLRLAGESPESLDGHLAQWLYTVCRRRAIDVRRKENRMHSLSMNCWAESCEPSTRDADVLQQQEETSRVLAALAQLPWKQQEAVRLKFQHGLNYREIAGVMETSVNHVGVLLHTALRSIRKKLAEQEQHSGQRDECHVRGAHASRQV